MKIPLHIEWGGIGPFAQPVIVHKNKIYRLDLVLLQLLKNSVASGLLTEENIEDLVEAVVGDIT